MRREVAEELVTPAGIVEPKLVEVPEESIFIPPFLETLSSVARPLGRPICLVVPKREGNPFVHAVATICQEIYRIVKGGNPTPRWISKGLKDEIERYLKAEDMVFVIDDSKCELLPDFSKIQHCVEGPKERRFVEIETFYSTGDPVMKLDKETLRKYMERGVRRVDVLLLTGLHALLYAQELVKLREIYRKKHGLEVNFYVPNVKDRRLVPLGEVLQQLRDATSSQEQAGGFTEDYANTSRKRSASSTPDL